MPACDPATIAGDDEQLLHAAVREAGALAADHFRGPARSWTKDDGTPVSQADLEVNDLLKTRLHGERPDYGWLSEETRDTADRLSDSRIWIVDPIDGTRAFLEGSENWCIAAALIEHGRPILGAVYVPLSDRMYSARKDGGAWRNDTSLQTSARPGLEGSKIIAHRNILQPERWQRQWPHVEVGMTTSLALRLCLVADGTYDAALAVGSKSDWDLAAGDLIVHEAGGRVSNLTGQALVYNTAVTHQTGLVACGAGLHDEMIGFASGYKRK